MPQVTYAVSDSIATITLDAPDRRNALSVEMSRELDRRGAHRRGRPRRRRGRRDRWQALLSRGAVRAVLADAGRDPVEDEAYRNLETVYRAFTTIGEAAVPTVAAVRGAAVGAGLNLALATDLRIVSRTARLLPGFAQIGIHPGGGHFTLLNRVAGREAAAAMGLFGDEINGERAVALGLGLGRLRRRRCRGAGPRHRRPRRGRPRAGPAGRPQLPPRDRPRRRPVGRRRRGRALAADVVAAPQARLGDGCRGPSEANGSSVRRPDVPVWLGPRPPTCAPGMTDQSPPTRPATAALAGQPLASDTSESRRPQGARPLHHALSFSALSTPSRAVTPRSSPPALGWQRARGRQYFIRSDTRINGMPDRRYIAKGV